MFVTTPASTLTLKLKTAEKVQYPLIKEYSFNHIRDPTIIEGIFLN